MTKRVAVKLFFFFLRQNKTEDLSSISRISSADSRVFFSWHTIMSLPRGHDVFIENFLFNFLTDSRSCLALTRRALLRLLLFTPTLTRAFSLYLVPRFFTRTADTHDAVTRRASLKLLRACKAAVRCAARLRAC